MAQISDIGGGHIGRTCRAELVDGQVVVVKQCPYPADQEAEGLRALAAAGVPTPAVLGVRRTVLVLEYLPPAEPDWVALGRVIAAMHRCTGDRFGWSRNNFHGRFEQDNSRRADWPTFYTECRVLSHLAHAEVPDALRRRVERACAGPLRTLLRSEAPASLTHGDLWAGNVVGGRYLVDPAVSYADRELDLAYLRLAGPLPPAFLDSYQAVFPLAAGFQERYRALQLYKFIVNVRHFGPRYHPRIEEVLDYYGW